MKVIIVGESTTQITAVKLIRQSCLRTSLQRHKQCLMKVVEVMQMVVCKPTFTTFKPITMLQSKTSISVPDCKVSTPVILQLRLKASKPQLIWASQPNSSSTQTSTRPNKSLQTQKRPRVSNFRNVQLMTMIQRTQLIQLLSHN